jgi:tRNA (adenine57-N1/adenine58-N1)-methyltransferase
MAEENVRRFYGAAPNWTLRVADAFAGIGERDVDRAVIDLAEPWRLLDAVACCTRPGAVLTCYVPTVLQVKQLVDALRSHAHFDRVEAMETWVRFWHVQAMSVRPEHRMIGHTGFIVVSHRIEPATAAAPSAATAR